MEFSLKEALGFVVAVICAILLILSLYNFSFFAGIGHFIEGVV